MSPAEELRAAAMRLRERAHSATPGPWRYHDAHLGHLGGHTATVLAGEGNDTQLVAWLPSRSQEPWATHPCWANSMWSALVNPMLAEPLAALLEESARTIGGHQQMADYAGLPDHRWCLGCQDEECEGLMALDKALDVARSINGTAGTES